MISDLISSLRQMGEPSELAAASHVLKEGLYVLIDVDGLVYQELLIEKGGEYTGEPYESIKPRDFLSNIIEMNKPVDKKKKIHSNNIYSFSFKYDGPQRISVDEDKKNMVNIYDEMNMEEHVNRYFDSLKNWYEDNKKLLVNTSIKPVDEEKLKNCMVVFLKSMPMVVKLVEKYELKAGKYIKLFINVPISEYTQASNLYLFPKIFNNNDSNVEIEGITLGLSNANMGLNSKKPYLSHMTTQYKVPYRVKLAEALDAFRLLIWINSQNIRGVPQNNGYLSYEQSDEFTLLEQISGNTPAQYLHFTREKAGAEIDDYEVLSCAQKDLDKYFKPVNYLSLPKYDYKIITQINQLESLVDELLFNKCLVRNYFFDPKPKLNVLSSRQAAIIQLSKNAFISYFKKSDKTSIKNLIDKVSFEMILEKLNQTDYHSPEYTTFAKALNLRFALLEYFEIGGKNKLGSNIMNIYEELKTILLIDKPQKPIVCESDEMFYFAVGQLARYLVGLSKAQKISYSFINPILKAKNSTKIKRELVALIKKYSYEINLWDKQHRSRFDNLQAFVNSYESESEDNKIDLILAGFASPNLIYYKIGGISK